ncbi:hypothetical protein KQI84_13410 [bacterium]|nr:hypothetical protein [bacterium]
MTTLVPIVLLGQFSLNDPNDQYFLKWGAAFVVGIIILMFVQHFIRQSVQKRSSSLRGEEERLDELSQLKKRGLLSEEEMKRVREAMARKFVERQAEASKPAETGKGFSALEALAMEAERAESDLVAKKSEPKIPESPPPDAPGEPPPPSRPRLPERLESLLKKTETDWEDMRNAGFLSDDDVELLRAARAAEVGQ